MNWKLTTPVPKQQRAHGCTPGIDEELAAIHLRLGLLRGILSRGCSLDGCRHGHGFISDRSGFWRRSLGRRIL